jgi:hypothetical protein
MGRIKYQETVNLERSENEVGIAHQNVRFSVFMPLFTVWNLKTQRGGYTPTGKCAQWAKTPMGSLGKKLGLFV